MKSITHTPSKVTSTRQPNQASHSSSEQESDHIRGFHYDPRRAALGYDYLRRKWLPREGPLFYAFIQVMRSHCYFNAQTGEIRESCYPKVETIANECGVDQATIHRLIKRDQTTGEFISKHAEALKRFIKVQPRWLYDPKVGHKTQRSSVYLVALDDPPVPEDDHLVEEKAGELAAILTMEQVRQQQQGSSPPNAEPELTDLQNASQYALAKCESVMSRKMQDRSVLLSNTSKTYLDRTIDGRPPAEKSIRTDFNTLGDKRALVGEQPAASTQGEMSHPARRTHRLHRATPSEKQAQKQEISPHAHALAQAQHLAGETIRILLDDLGASNPTGGVQTILEALVEVDTPGDKLHELVALGKHRLAQQQELITIPNPTGYLIGIMRNLAVEALLKGWNVAQLRAEDEEKHAQALRRTPRAGAQSPTPEEDAAPPEEVPVPMPEPPDEATSESQADQQEAAWEVERRAAEEEARHYAALSPDPRARQVWQSVLDRIQPKVSQSAFATWFRGTNGLAFEGETLIVRVGSGFGRTHLETRFYDLIERAVHEQWDAHASARFVVVEDSQEGDALLMTPEQEAGDDDC